MPTSQTHESHATLTLRCNNRCVFCAQRALAERPDALPDVPIGTQSVVIHGGEPTLHPELVEYIAGLREQGVERILLQTNGRRLAYPNVVETLVDAGLTHVDISLHGHQPEVHDYHTNVPRSFKHTAKGILNAAGSPLHVGVTTVVTRSNFRHLRSIATLLTRMKVDAWHLAAARPFPGDAIWERVAPRLGMISEGLQTALEAAHAAKLPTVTTGIPACISGARGVSLDSARIDPSAPQCVMCPAMSRCGGAYPGHPDKFSAIDLVPVSAKPADVTLPEALWFGQLGETG